MKATTILAALGFVLGANAGCTDVSRSEDGNMQAYCTDEVTGFDFIYEDLDGHVEQLLGKAEPASAMYDAYLSGINNATDLSFEKRGFYEYWKYCADKITGACSNDHTIAWVGSGSALIGAITGVVASVNHSSRLGSKPRSKCTNYHNNGTICVSWAAYYHSQMSNQQVKDLARECEQECGKKALSCEARVVTDNVAEYFCVSDRAKGCTDDNKISKC